jgi:hypothetical protein
MRARRLVAIVVVLAPALLGAEERPAKVPMASPPGSTSGIRAMRPTGNPVTERDAREWLTRYQSAWQARDVAAILALGVIHEDQQPALRKALSSYKRLDISVSNEKIAVDAGRTLVSFDRVDVDETGRHLHHPRQTVLLERMPVGVVSTWRNVAASR